MVCCLALAGLMLLGPRGVQLYRLLRRHDAAPPLRREPSEPVLSRNLVVSQIGRSDPR
jgi:hypothetical protein